MVWKVGHQHSSGAGVRVGSRREEGEELGGKGRGDYGGGWWEELDREGRGCGGGWEEELGRGGERLEGKGCGGCDGEEGEGNYGGEMGGDGRRFEWARDHHYHHHQRSPSRRILASSQPLQWVAKSYTLEKAFFERNQEYSIHSHSHLPQQLLPDPLPDSQQERSEK